MATKTEIDNAVNIYEDEDRWVTSAYLTDNYNDITVTSTPILCPVDLIVNVSGIEYNIEIKKREKDKQILQQYPYAELKLNKYNGMVDFSGDTPLYYFVLLNEKWLYGFDLRKESTWKDSYVYDWKIKKTQVDNDSEKVIQQIYEIPYRNAQIKEHISKYYKDYNIMKYGNNL